MIIKNPNPNARLIFIRFIKLILQKERRFAPLWFVTFEEKINIYV
uniref:Uncharacterized protein n=1 Tax=uncultured bacterium A1Q1_fos_97 TaxID=1256593 RepID=L7W0E1_9BACT|nr:hypothetical protein [uncultured bacterium A1Q1_fos_97]